MVNHNSGDNVLVTGATGFLGREIVRQFAETGVSVHAIAHRSPIQGRSHDNVRYSRGDVTDYESMLRACRGSRVVLHAAGLAHQFGRSSSQVDAFQHLNVKGTQTITRAAVACSVEHLILVSSVSVYGPRQQPVAETADCRPTDSYGQSKLQAEQVANRIATDAGMRLTILRMATIYGEDDPGNIRRLIQSIDRQRFIWIGNGSNRKSLIYRGDAAQACLLVAMSTFANSQHVAASHEIYNVSSPPVTVAEIVHQISAALGQDSPSWHIPGALTASLFDVLAACSFRRGPADRVRRMLKKWLSDDIYVADHFRNEFQFKSQVSLEEGLCRETAWYRRSQAA